MKIGFFQSISIILLIITQFFFQTVILPFNSIGTEEQPTIVSLLEKQTENMVLSKESEESKTLLEQEQESNRTSFGGRQTDITEVKTTTEPFSLVDVENGSILASGENITISISPPALTVKFNFNQTVNSSIFHNQTGSLIENIRIQVPKTEGYNTLWITSSPPIIMVQRL